jgi:hypothetical protein
MEVLAIARRCLRRARKFQAGRNQDEIMNVKGYPVFACGLGLTAVSGTHAVSRIGAAQVKLDMHKSNPSSR